MLLYKCSVYRRKMDERFREEIDRIKDACVIVEGKKDRAALESLGFTDVHPLKGPLFSFAESIAEKTKDVVVLTDLDSEGKQIYSKLANSFSRLGVRIDNRFREYLFRHTDLRQIEGLDTYLKKEK
jgi:5S rRNA maturation endonuclease (ribonuclease M5)